MFSWKSRTVTMVHSDGTRCRVQDRGEMMERLLEHDGHRYTIGHGQRGQYILYRSSHRYDHPSGPGAFVEMASGRTRADCENAMFRKVFEGWDLGNWQEAWSRTPKQRVRRVPRM